VLASENRLGGKAEPCRMEPCSEAETPEFGVSGKFACSGLLLPDISEPQADLLDLTLVELLDLAVSLESTFSNLEERARTNSPSDCRKHVVRPARALSLPQRGVAAGDVCLCAPVRSEAPVNDEI